LCSLLPRESRSHVRCFYNKTKWTITYDFYIVFPSFPRKHSTILEVIHKYKKTW
jgi:hypothetical protein